MSTNATNTSGSAAASRATGPVALSVMVLTVVSIGLMVSCTRGRGRPAPPAVTGGEAEETPGGDLKEGVPTELALGPRPETTEESLQLGKNLRRQLLCLPQRQRQGERFVQTPHPRLTGEAC